MYKGNMYTSDVGALNGEVCSVFTNHNCNKYAKKYNDLKLKEPKEKKRQIYNTAGQEMSDGQIRIWNETIMKESSGRTNILKKNTMVKKKNGNVI